MIHYELTEELAELLGIERHEAASLFNGFCGAMVAELLAFRKLSIRGLGSFSVTHIPATKRSSGSAMIFAPPLNKLRFEGTLSSGDETISLAVSRLSMSQSEAARFARTLSSLFTAALQQEKEMMLNGLGRFAIEDGAYSFFPDRTLEELLNREYQDLKEVVLPQNKELKRAKALPGYVLPLSAVILVGLLLAVLYGRFSSHTFFSSNAKSPKSVATAVDRRAGVVTSSPSARRRELLGTVADSLVLVQGDYALVLATFESEKRAIKELAPLRSAGINAFLWPAYMDGIKYFRLMTGRFATRDAAAARLKEMPPKMVSGAYIQQVKKTVVVHGEKGL